MTAPHACPSYVTEGAAGDSNRSADWRVSKVNRPRMQCNPSWKTRRKRFGQENITSLTMRDKKEAWDALTADVNAVSSSRRKPDELKKIGKSLPATLAQIWLNASTPARVGDRSREKALTQTWSQTFSAQCLLWSTACKGGWTSAMTGSSRTIPKPKFRKSVSFTYNVVTVVCCLYYKLLYSIINKIKILHIPIKKYIVLIVLSRGQ